MSLKDKTVLVTGASSGIGQAVAIRFAEDGANVVVNYRENRKGGEETVQQIKKAGGDALLVQADVSKETEVTRLLNATTKKYGMLDILVNNAGIGTDKVPYMDMDYGDMKEMIDADLTSVLMCSQRAVRIMEKQGGGKILNTSSIRGWEHGGRAPVYAAAKAAVNSFTRTLAKQVAPTVQVNAVAPGFVKTRSYDGMTKEKLESFLEQTALKRWVTKEEIAEAFVFLANNDAMTGQVLYVDAGFTLK